MQHARRSPPSPRRGRQFLQVRSNATLDRMQERKADQQVGNRHQAHTRDARSQGKPTERAGQEFIRKLGGSLEYGCHQQRLAVEERVGPDQGGGSIEKGKKPRVADREPEHRCVARTTLDGQVLVGGNVSVNELRFDGPPDHITAERYCLRTKLGDCLILRGHWTRLGQVRWATPGGHNGLNFIVRGRSVKAEYGVRRSKNDRFVGSSFLWRC
jgi:hypothetical protein